MRQVKKMWLRPASYGIMISLVFILTQCSLKYIIILLYTFTVPVQNDSTKKRSYTAQRISEIKWRGSRLVHWSYSLRTENPGVSELIVIFVYVALKNFLVQYLGSIVLLGISRYFRSNCPVLFKTFCLKEKNKSTNIRIQLSLLPLHTYFN